MKSIIIDSTITSKLHRIYKCSVCNEIFDGKNMYRNHMLHHEKDIGNTYKCNICGKSFAVPARLTRHYRTHTGEKPFQCEYCKKSFSVKENLSVHRRIHTKERPYKCEICEKAFEHSGKLHRHMRVHTGERPHKCLSCNKTFIQSGQLVIHTRTHTGEKPYVCKSCKKGFTCSKQLKVHSRTHTGEKPYKCDICNKSFGYNHVLKLHQAAHYGEKFYKCILCQHTFNSKKLMEIHLKTHSEQSINFFSESISTSENFQHKLTHNNDQPLFIKNKIDCENQKYNNNFKACEEEKTHEPPIPLYKDYCTQINTEANENVSFQTSPKTYTLTNSKSFFSEKISLFNTKINCIKNFSVGDEVLSETRDYDHFISGKSCFYKIQDVHQEPNKSSCDFDCNNITQDRVDNIIKQKYDQKYCSNNSQDMDLFGKLSSVQHNKIQSALFRNEIDLEETSRKKIISLPPRKRTKMILESMEIEKIESTNKNQHHSVIKFAKGNNLI